MANLQQARRTNPYPWSWEIPVGAAIAVGLVLVLTVHVARAVANWSSGAPWAFTESRAIFTSLPAILTGDPTAGLTEIPTNHASSTAVLIWVILFELAVIVVTIWVAVLTLRRFGSGRIKGMATPDEVDQVLGLTRLRKHAHIVRPDLHAVPGKARR
ncbi:MAG: hypothetical protein P1U38_13805 [Aeromicrobium sp.]|uniref:hypothetical protein n=1 Tax=Aeromicrobium sp. TaxID=1871063 RepID=UPI0026220F29|nr:hypothetical protein [Aeromicrobium sp.]MDF1705840.1 hypothetical protein [Aeromicrobium sp.]